ncbi:hypothetical protein DFJ63DRAFT_335179 [Scheffersomyces coipomensis]|uniref:uncharacterized protein n=1 Tax=Scheffersomyces coipomensis TaxID=1788519 RepID=UPI00315D11EA
MGGTDIEKFIRSNHNFRESRLRSLYSNFDRQKQLNPEGFDANIIAWKHLLHDLLKSHQYHDSSLVSFPVINPNLSQYLSLPIYGRPLSLGTVLDELVSSFILIPYSEYSRVNQSYFDIISSNHSLLEYISPKHWIQWGLENFGLSSHFTSINSKGELYDERYISWEILTKLGNDLLKYVEQEEINNHGSYSSKLYDNQRLYDLVKKKEPKLSTLDFDIILIYFSRDLQKCKIKRVNEKVYIKFIMNEITDSDMGIIDLETSLFNIDKRNRSLKRKIEDIDQQIQELISNKKIKLDDVRDRLRHFLQLKKIFNQSLNKGISSYSELQLILIKINDSNQNIDIYQQLVTSNQILKQLNSRINFSDITDVKEELGQEFVKSDEISDRLNMELIVDDSSIEEELQELYREVEVRDDKDRESLNRDHAEVVNKLGALTIDATSLPKISTRTESDNEQGKQAVKVGGEPNKKVQLETT